MKRVFLVGLLLIVIALTGCGSSTSKVTGPSFTLTVEPTADDSKFIIQGTFTDANKVPIIDAVIVADSNVIPYVGDKYYGELLGVDTDDVVNITITHPSINPINTNIVIPQVPGTLTMALKTPPQDLTAWINRTQPTLTLNWDKVVVCLRYRLFLNKYRANSTLIGTNSDYTCNGSTTIISATESNEILTNNPSEEVSSIDLFLRAESGYAFSNHSQIITRGKKSVLSIP